MAARKSTSRKSATPARGGKKTVSKKASTAVVAPVAAASRHYSALPNSRTPFGPGAFIPRSTGFFSRVLNGIGSLFKSKSGGGPSAPTTRNFAFSTFGGVAFFATHPSALSVFGFRHGDRLEYGSGDLSGTCCIVVGLRAGSLWVANDMSTEAGTIATPLSGMSYAELRDSYHFKKVLSLSEVRQDKAAQEFPSTVARRLLNFLQFAPDLELSVPELNASATLSPCSSNGVATVLMAPVFNMGTGMGGWGASGTVYNVSGSGIPSPVESAGISIGCQAFHCNVQGLIEESSDDEEEVVVVAEEEESAADEEEDIASE